MAQYKAKQQWMNTNHHGVEFVGAAQEDVVVFFDLHGVFKRHDVGEGGAVR